MNIVACSLLILAAVAAAVCITARYLVRHEACNPENNNEDEE